MDDWRPPLLCNLGVHEIQQLSRGLVCGKRRLGLGDFAQLAMIALHSIGGVDQSPDFLGIVEKGSQALPMGSPRPLRPSSIRLLRI